jgi:hypothetical protein
MGGNTTKTGGNRVHTPGRHFPNYTSLAIQSPTPAFHIALARFHQVLASHRLKAISRQAVTHKQQLSNSKSASYSVVVVHKSRPQFHKVVVLVYLQHK